MKEIITIQLGRSGNQIGCKFWEMISNEHGIDPTRTLRGDDERQREYIDVFYHKSFADRCIPRAVIVDLDVSQIGEMRDSTPFEKILQPENYFFLDEEGTGKNWAKGFYTQGPKLIEPVLEAVRKEVDACDSLQGFILFHSLGGGTGAGMGSLIIAKLKEEFPEKPIVTFSVFPSSFSGNSAAATQGAGEFYNATLAIEHLIKNADLTFCLDNEQLNNICRRSFKLTTPTWDDLNHIAAQTISGLTAPLRFPLVNGERWTLKNLVDNLVPSPHLKFITPGLAPLLPRGSSQYHSRTLAELIPNMFNAENMMAAVDPHQGRLLNAYTSFRGSMSTEKVSEQMAKLQTENADYILSSHPNSVKNLVCNIPTGGLKFSVTFANNTTAIQGLFMRVSERFDLMFRRKSFTNWYTDEGMDELEFTKAERNLNALISEYQQAAGEEIESAPDGW